MNLKNSLIVGMLAIATASYGQDQLQALVGHKAPSFKMTDLHGHILTNQKLLGKVVVLDFWATWCGPCKKASPAMEKLHEKYAKEGLVVIGAETGENGAPPGAKAYAAEHHYTYAFTTDNDQFTAKLGINGIPAFVIIGRDGKVAKTLTGVDRDINVFYKSFESVVKPLLAAGTP